MVDCFTKCLTWMMRISDMLTRTVGVLPPKGLYRPKKYEKALTCDPYKPKIENKEDCAGSADP